MFEILTNIPKETTLKISIVDKKRFFGGEEIGETTIDLENRLLTKHRATVGLPEMYNLFGPLPWRDQLPPMEILSRYCRKMHYKPPKVLITDDDCGLEVFGSTVWLKAIQPDEALKCDAFLGRPIQRVALFILQCIGLVPEHVETRPLFSAINPDLEVGKLECFIDIFPKCLGTIPPAIDISPRKPNCYQLRLAVFKTRNVILLKKSFGTPAADLYVRCYLNGATKAEKTDIHFRCMDGAASFNYRLLFNFEYDPWERMISAKKKTRLFRKASSELVDPVLIIQLCDNNKFKKDVVIGEIKVPLLGFEEGQPSDEDMAYIPNKMPILSLFQHKAVRGWWPCLSTKVPKEQRSDYSEKKKDDDYDPLKRYVTGMLEMELSLVSAAEAKLEPVGKKRGKPNRNPFLPRPDRSKWDYFWCTSRFRVAMKFFWKKCGAQFLCYLVIVLIIALLIASFIWQFPNIVGAVTSNSINNALG
uniref:C2 domain-containing protein n=1 Tax=Panagrolaimus davidi TaxID=227884 RepID=A0A914P2G8_9BILA